jgi:hypothetical protein
LAGISANISTGIRLASTTLNAVYRIHRIVSTIQNALAIFNFVTKLYSFINTFTLALSTGSPLGPALSTALGAGFGINAASLAPLTPGITAAFNYIGNRWTNLRNRITRNAGRMAAAVAENAALQRIILSQAVKREPIALLLNLPSPPAGIPWSTIPLPIIELPGGFRIKLQSDGRAGRLFGIGAVISGKSKDHNVNIIRVDYQKVHRGVGTYAPHANVGPNNEHMDI